MSNMTKSPFLFLHPYDGMVRSCQIFQKFKFFLNLLIGNKPAISCYNHCQLISHISDRTDHSNSRTLYNVITFLVARLIVNCYEKRHGNHKVILLGVFV